MAPQVAGAQEIVIPGKSPPCEANANFTVADFSVPLTQVKTDKTLPALHALKAFNVKTIFRYYDHADETLPQKTLLPEEAKAILAAGFKIGVVFQHHNDDPAKFLVPDVGRKDGERALDLARINKQPYGSAIYFGIDAPELHFGKLVKEHRRNNGDVMSSARREQLEKQGAQAFVESYHNFLSYGPGRLSLKNLEEVQPAMMKPVIAQYIKDIRSTFEEHKRAHHGRTYKLGLYCTGAMCVFADNAGLADYYWVSPEGRSTRPMPTSGNGAESWAGSSSPLTPAGETNEALSSYLVGIVKLPHPLLLETPL